MCVLQKSRSRTRTNRFVIHSMNRLDVVLAPLFILFFFNHVRAQDSPESVTHFFHSFHPKASAVIGVIAIMFSIICLILTYAKFCHRRHNRFNLHNHPGLLRSNSRESGIDKTVIDQIPFFRFASLKGLREGLECAVCLSVFEEQEILRLLPKCKHAFHKNCIDEWLESHSSCPLCRHRFDAADVTSCSYSNRISHIPSDLFEDRYLELYIEREQDRPVSSRFSFGSSLLKSGQSKRAELPIREDGTKRDEEMKLLDKFKHKIIVSDVVVRNRWSDFNSSDLFSLSSEMLNDTSSQRFRLVSSNSARFHTRNSKNEQVVKIKKDMEKKRLYESTFGRLQRSNSASSSTSNHEHHASRQLNATEKRSKSEITKVARFMELSPQTNPKESPLTEISIEEERTRRLWLPIAQRSLQLFAGREIQELDSKKRPSNV